MDNPYPKSYQGHALLFILVNAIQEQQKEIEGAEEWGPKVDAAYISFKEGHVEVTTMRITDDIAIDFGPHEEIVGIEILDASKHLELSPEHPEIKLENLVSS